MPESTELSNWLTRQSWPDVAAMARQPNLTIYRHPYGFVVVRLMDTPFPGWGIRLHVWPSKPDFDAYGASRQTIDQRVHSHGWDIWTKVILGEVQQVQFDSSESAAADGLLAYRVASDFGTGFSRLSRTTNRYSPRTISSEIRTSRDSAYLIPMGEFHQTFPVLADRPSATVIASQIVTTNESIVLAPANAPSEIDNRREDVADIGQILSALDTQYVDEMDGSDRWVSFVLFESGGRILLVRPHRDPSRWQPIGGQSDSGDVDSLATVRREVREEIGWDVQRTELQHVVDVPRDVGNGQMHVWAAKLHPDIELQATELYEARWFSINEALELSMLPGTRKAIEVLAGSL